MMIYKATLDAMDTFISHAVCIAIKEKGEVELDLRRRLQVSRLAVDQHVTDRADSKLPATGTWRPVTSLSPVITSADRKDGR